MRVHLVDGTYELFRAHFSGRPDHRSRSGQEVKATVGVLFSLASLLRDERVTHIAVAFDNPIESFRNDLFAGYKTSAGVPSELLAQFDLVERTVAAMGIVVWSMDRWEADDALATGAARACEDNRVQQVRILTPDKDLGQCVRADRVVQVDRVRRKVIDESVVRALRVAPASIPDYLALVGDDADGIPGVPGFGAKTVKALLDRWGHIDAIPDDPRSWDVPIRGGVRLAESLATHRDEVRIYRRLATLIHDVDLKENIDQLRWTGVVPDSFLAMCDELDLDERRARPLPFG